MVPASTSASQFSTRARSGSPKSRIGRRRIRPVWISVSTSKSSSKVPKPPGKTAIARARIRKCILRMAK